MNIYELNSLNESLLTYQEVADILHIKPQTLRAWVSAKKIPCIKLGTAVRFTKEQIETIVNNGLKEAIHDK